MPPHKAKRQDASTTEIPRGFEFQSANSLPRAPLGITVLPMTTLSFKVSDDEARLIRALAERERLSLSEYLRRRASGVGEPTAPARVRCGLTGAMIFAPSAGETPLTTAAVKEMLSDFP